MKKVNIFTILSLVALIGGYIVSSFFKTMDTIIIVNLICAVLALIFAIASIVNAKKIEKSKAPGIVLLIISILGTLLFLILFAFFNLVKDPKNTEDICKQVVRCKQDSSEVSTCYLDADSNNLVPIKCYNSNLKSNQYE